jgi:hypothetical protein
MEPRDGPVCSLCGWEEESPQASPNFLAPRTVLDGRYLLGRVLGAGGFGITYLAWELNLNFKLAIKEYFPNSFGTRGRDHSTVVPANSQSRDAFDHGLDKFLEEGRALARFQGHPSIASVMTFFKANGTSYLVMKYEDGITLQEYLKQHGGRLDFEMVKRIAMPILDALRAVHGEGILHRDISPDNVIINRSRQVKILDFGSAKRDMTVRDSTLQITLKRGFSPEEQYRANGKQGPWTDVYAVGATLYQCLTRAKPPDALDRLSDDTLVPPFKCGVKMPPRSEKALLKALAVRGPDRFQTIEDFREALISQDPRPNLLDGLMAWLRAQAATLRQLAAAQRPHARKLSWGAAAAVAVLALLRMIPALLAVPEIREFAVDPPVIAAGQAVTLRWSTSGGKIGISPGIGPLTERAGTRQVFPTGNTTYTLTAKGALHSAARTASVSITPGGPVATTLHVSVTAEPANIKAGGSSELVWSVEGKPDRVTIDQGIGAVAESGRLRVSPSTTTSYLVKAEGPGGVAVEGSVTVSVGPTVPKPVIVSLTVDPPSIRKGQYARLSWQVTGDNPAVSFDHDIGKVNAQGTINVAPAVPTQYKLNARNAGGSVSKTVDVGVVEPEAPKITFSARPDSIPYGGSATLQWSVTGEVNSVNIAPAIGSVTAESSLRVSLAETRTYTLTANGPGGTATQDVTVRVAAPHAPTISFKALPGVIVPKQTVTLTWKVEGDVDSVTLDPGGKLVSKEGSAIDQPARSTRYSITAKGPGGSLTSAADIHVSTEPVAITEFKADKTKIKHGEAVRLTWKVAGPITGVTIAPGNIQSGAQGTVVLAPEKDTEYTLSARAGELVLGTKTIKISVKK